jgi:hypothetical protein
MNHAGFEVEIDPAEATDLTGAEAECRHNAQRGAQPVLCGCCEEASHLLGGQRSTQLRRFRLGREIGKSRGVARDVATTLGPAERLTQHSSEANQRRLRQASDSLRLEERVDVFGRQRAKPVMTEARRDV